MHLSDAEGSQLLGAVCNWVKRNRRSGVSQLSICYPPLHGLFSTDLQPKTRGVVSAVATLLFFHPLGKELTYQADVNKFSRQRRTLPNSRFTRQSDAIDQLAHFIGIISAWDGELRWSQDIADTGVGRDGGSRPCSVARHSWRSPSGRVPLIVGAPFATIPGARVARQGLLAGDVFWARQGFLSPTTRAFQSGTKLTSPEYTSSPPVAAQLVAHKSDANHGPRFPVFSSAIRENVGRWPIQAFSWYNSVWLYSALGC